MYYVYGKRVVVRCWLVYADDPLNNSGVKWRRTLTAVTPGRSWQRWTSRLLQWQKGVLTLPQRQYCIWHEIEILRREESFPFTRNTPIDFRTHALTRKLPIQSIHTDPTPICTRALCLTLHRRRIENYARQTNRATERQKYIGPAKESSRLAPRDSQ